MQIGNIADDKGFSNPQRGRVYSTDGISPSLDTCNGGGREPKIMITKPMKRERTLHQQVRVIYRACRRLYGKEKTQNECLMVFKVVYPELYRLKKSEEERETLDESVRPSLQRIVKSWHPTGRLRQLADRVDNLIGLPFDYGREELIALLEDITPVAMRIRKLTPRECFRLMGVAEKDIDTIQSSSVSKSANDPGWVTSTVTVSVVILLGTHRSTMFW